jgi:hypothetical protein
LGGFEAASTVPAGKTAGPFLGGVLWHDTAGGAQPVVIGTAAQVF